MSWLLPQRGKPLCTLIASKEREIENVVYLSGTETFLTLESSIFVSALSYEGVLDKVDIFFVPIGSISKGFPNHLFKVRVCDRPPQQISDVKLPAILMKNERRVISGLCSTIRYILLRHERNEILGFRASCLASCAQVSPWTAFCERHMPATAVTLHNQEPDKSTQFPQALLLLEHNLRQPVRTHNDKHLKRILKVDELRHDFVEGNVITLSDLLLFLPVHLVIKYLLRRFSFPETIPKVLEWHKRMLVLYEKKPELAAFLSLNLGIDNSLENNDEHEILKVGKLPLPTTCLFSRSKLNAKISIKNKDATVLLNALRERRQSDFSCTSRFGKRIDWDGLPEKVRPESGSLPPDRIARKREQISNVVNAVVSLAQDKSITIVDFCSGGGHVGIALAYLLPKSRIYLIENKDGSMCKARERVHLLGLENVWFYQCNLDQFFGVFDLGVALHACGGATDLVIENCLEANASLVCVPCCYGSISRKEPNHSILKTVLDEHEGRLYEELCHLADRNENPEGDFCMECVDTDRGHRMRIAGYNVELTKLVPLTCTPKNNMIIAEAPNFVNLL